MRARDAALIGVGLAVAVAAIALARRPGSIERRAVETTQAIRVVRRDRMGLPEKKGVVRDPARVRALTEALGVDVLPGGACPPDYADADIGLVLSGSDVYARYNVYVFDLDGNATDAGPPADALAPHGSPTVVSVTSAGCRVGPPADLAGLRGALREAGVID